MDGKRLVRIVNDLRACAYPEGRCAGCSRQGQKTDCARILKSDAARVILDLASEHVPLTDALYKETKQAIKDAACSICRDNIACVNCPFDAILDDIPTVVRVKVFGHKEKEAET